MKKIFSLFILIYLFTGCLLSGPGHTEKNSSSAKEIYHEALDSYGKKEYEQAEILLKETIKLDSLFYPAYSALFNVYVSTGMAESGIAYFKSLETRANPYPAWTLGLLYEQKGMYDRAILSYKKTIRLGGSFYGGYEGLINVYVKKSANDKNAAEEARKYISELIQSSPEAAGPHFAMGYLFFRQNNFKASRTEYEQALRGKSPFVQVFYRAGELFYYQSDFKKALTNLEKALSLSKETGDKPLAGTCLSAIGASYIGLRDFKTAAKYLKQALSAARKRGDPADEASILNYLGHTYSYGDPKRQKSFERSLEIAGQTGDKRQEGRTLFSFGFNYPPHDPKSSEYFEAALQLARESGDIWGELKNLHLLGEINKLTENFPKAFEYFEKALSIAVTIGDYENEGTFLSSLGYIYYALSDFQKAITYSEKALKIHEETGNKYGESWALTELGKGHYGLSNSPDAIEYLEKALKVHREIDNKYGEGWTLMYAGLVYTGISMYPQALEQLEASLALFKKMGDKGGQAGAANSLGLAYQGMQDFPRALKYLQRSLVLHREVSDKDGEAWSLHNLGLVYYELADYQKAFEYFEESRPLFKSLNNKTGEGKALAYLGLVYYRLKEYTRALDYFDKGLVLWKKTGNIGTISMLLAFKGNLYQDLGEYTKALSFYKEAIAATESIRGRFKNEELKTSFFKEQVDLYDNTIKCLYELHLRDRAKGYDRLAFTYAESSKARGLLDLLAESDADIKEGVSPELIRQEQELEKEYSRINTDLQKLSSAPEEGLDTNMISLLKEKLTIIDKKAAELQNELIRTNPRYAGVKYPEPVTAALVQENLLDENTLCIEYKVTGDALFAWVITRETFDFYKIPIKEEHFNEKVLALRNCLTEEAEAEIFAAHSAGLYNRIVAPLLDRENKKDTLLIIPDAILNYLPFETLAALPGNRELNTPYEKMPFLIKEYTISYAQSATVAYNLAGRKKSRSTENELLALGDPVFSTEEIFDDTLFAPAMLNEEERNNLKRLFFSGREVNRIGSFFTDPAIYIREEAKEEWIKSPELQKYRYIHLAAHGILNETSPRLSGIVLAQDDDPAEDGFLLTREIFNLKLNADLVVLSACSTGLGKQVKGEGIVGLTRAWFYAGASSLVVSLWNINDYSTSTLMEHFYKNIQKGSSYSRALREAKLEMIESENSGGQKRYANPYYWAGFILQGGVDKRVEKDVKIQ